MVIGSGQLAIGEPAGAQANVAVTGPRFQPLAPGAGLSTTDIEGGPSAIVKGSLVTDAELPALSTAVPEMVRFVPSVAIVWSAGHAAIPEPSSEHVKCAVSAPPTIPPGPGVGASDTEIVGL